jgi:alginate O-acetyltransferase complex protein AlgI
MAFVPVYILILGFTIVIDYVAGILIENSTGKKKKYYLLFSLIANIGVLFVFKYYNFFNVNLTLLFEKFSLSNPFPFLKILLPIGLSFHTFQAMSYTIEVYRGKQRAEKHFGFYALYVMFYPQLVAGPIERPQNILSQFREKQFFKYNRVVLGLKLIAWGLFKKVVIADRLTIVVDNVFHDLRSYNSLSLFIAIFFFSFQILIDFSAYSDIAIGSAKVMGFNLMKNFNNPYLSKNIKEFWSKWHISLSTWFRDYLYIPLGGNKTGLFRWFINIFIVFILSGIWHGANWTFLIWGMIHSLYYIVSVLTKKLRLSISNLFHFLKSDYLNIIFNFLLVSLAWIFFRAQNTSSALYIIKHIFISITNLNSSILNGEFSMQYLGISNIYLFLSILLIIIFQIIEYYISFRKTYKYFISSPFYARWLCYYTLIFGIIFFGILSNKQFIYFQF